MNERSLGEEHDAIFFVKRGSHLFISIMNCGLDRNHHYMVCQKKWIRESCFYVKIGFVTENVVFTR